MNCKYKFPYIMGLFVSVMMLSSCKSSTSPKGSSSVTTDDNYNIKIIDGCEYLEFDFGMFDNRVYSLTHKGNCKNPIHSK